MKKNKRSLLGAVTAVVLVVALMAAALAAYYAKGEFKDVFVNKQDYFLADVLYPISSAADAKREVSSGKRRAVNIYNYDSSTGDFNGFSVTFDVYAWLDSSLPDGKSYSVTAGDGTSVSIDTTEHTQPVLTGLTLAGGARSTQTLVVDFGFQTDSELAGAPGLHLVAAATGPSRLSKSRIGALLVPTSATGFEVRSDFETAGLVKDYAAFLYRVTSAGNAPTGGRIALKWNSQALTLITHNNALPTVSVEEGDFGNGMDRKIEWEAQSNNTDVFAFQRNGNHDMWSLSEQTWDMLREQIETEFIES